MKTVVLSPLYQSITFWICVAFFIYFTGTFFFFLFVNSNPSIEFIHQMNLIYGIVTIAKNIILCLSLLGQENLEVENEFSIPSEMNLDEFSQLNLKNL
jgi:hypothetical protein